jgi:hypothetical protein
MGAWMQVGALVKTRDDLCCSGMGEWLHVGARMQVSTHVNTMDDCDGAVWVCMCVGYFSISENILPDLVISSA